MSKRKLIVVGGGAAGFFAAINAAERYPELDIKLLERGKEVLQKVRISGGGRCNVTHACWTPKELVKHYPRGQKALLGPFHHFACGDTVAWFEDRGVPLKIEEDGRMFPTTNSSATIANCLLDSARRAGVQVLTRQRVAQIRPKAGGGFVVQAQQNFHADQLVLTPGSSKAVWQLLEQLGHRIIPPVPSLFTFNCKDSRTKGLAGVAVEGVEVQVLGQKALQASGPLLITHWGFSGPGILRLSAWGARWMHEQAYGFILQVNWLAGRGPTELVKERLQALKIELARKQIAKHTQFDLPRRLWERLVKASGIREQDTWAHLSKNKLQRLWHQLTQAEFVIKGKSTFKDEFVTAGGVDLDEINFKRFESKLFPNLFMAGEVLNIDAITGGFNFQAAWTGGWMIGQAVEDAGLKS